jgi:hypothetical protein
MALSSKGPWDLEVCGFEILTVIFAYQIDLVAYGDQGATASLRLAASFRLSQPDGEDRDLDAGQDSWEQLAVVLGLRHARISRALATEKGRLTVSFDSGHEIVTQPDGRPYEHWALRGPNFNLVCMPGDGSDGVALWDDNPKV